MTVGAQARSLDLNGKIRLQESLSLHTSFRIGGPAAYFVEPETLDDVRAALDFAKAHDLPWYVLGNGTNTLFPDEGFPGMVIHLGPGTGLSKLELRDDALYAEAGATLAAARRLCAAQGQNALDFLVGIPATIGGALAMNAGIPQAAIGDLVESLTVLDDEGHLKELTAAECGFGYRLSRIREEGLIVLAARLRLDSGACWDQAELLNRRKRQPLGRSPGCVFKNPPHFPRSAGWLIDKSGLKGYKVGNAQVSRGHGNFILNRGKAKCADVVTLIDIVRDKVYKEFKLQLSLELEVVLD